MCIIVIVIIALLLLSRKRKHVPCFYRVIETRVEGWEKENKPQVRSVSTAYSSSPKLSRVFLLLDRNTENMFSISCRKHGDEENENNLLTFIIKM